VRDVDTFEAERSFRRIQKADDRSPQGRLPTTGFADDPQRLPGLQRQRDSIDRVDVADRLAQQTGPDREVLDEVLDLEDRLAPGRAFVHRRHGGHRLAQDATPSSANFDVSPFISCLK
jgi:hypothetical protein